MPDGVIDGNSTTSFVVGIGSLTATFSTAHSFCFIRAEGTPWKKSGNTKRAPQSALRLRRKPPTHLSGRLSCKPQGLGTCLLNSGR
jgi:hypothetical protein